MNRRIVQATVLILALMLLLSACTAQDPAGSTPRRPDDTPPPINGIPPPTNGISPPPHGHPPPDEEWMREIDLIRGIFNSPAFISPEEMTIFGRPFFETDIDWAIYTATALGYEVMYHINPYTYDNRILLVGLKDTEARQYNTEGQWPEVFYGVELSYGWLHGRENVITASVLYGGVAAFIVGEGFIPSGRGPGDHGRMEVPPELRGIMRGDEAWLVFDKLGIGLEESEALLSLGGASMGIIMSDGQFSGYSSTYPARMGEYEFGWNFDGDSIVLRLRFDGDRRLVQIAYTSSITVVTD